ncbi:pentapeptide repeat-containing protein [Streptomyces sp. NPDC048279]|uniref:pentapeptide repeat-containing protein n=1 Tax=Streptomyces sp. NPDC048279 TaxID=3154714 RepID=UPI00341CB1E7
MTRELLARLLNAFRDPETSRPVIGEALFHSATFTGDVDFEQAKFNEYAWFCRVMFTGDAQFDRVAFTGGASFAEARFAREAWFRMAEFPDVAVFNRATFSGAARFLGAALPDPAFCSTTFLSDALFTGVSFENAPSFGPLVCKGEVELSGAVFRAPVTIEVAASELTCRRTRWVSTAALRLRYAALDLSDAVLEYPLTVTSHTAAFTDPWEETQLDESMLLGSARARLSSLSGADAAHLTLTDVDLAECRLTGTIHLDQLRMEGRCTFSTPPRRVNRRGWRITYWGPRLTLAEEHHWRTARGAVGWAPVPADADSVRPEALAPVYRHLRKAFEDSKNEPDAADFYYGEMEMRRHDTSQPFSERALLTAYWAASGYGLRASRALGWLLVAMTVTLLALTALGLPEDDPKPTSTGQLTAGRVTLITDTPEPVNPDGPPAERFTTDRLEKSLRVVINSVVFGSSGQDLTTAGIYIEMASRLTEPILLGLAVLAVRGRVKR